MGGIYNQRLDTILCRWHSRNCNYISTDAVYLWKKYLKALEKQVSI